MAAKRMFSIEILTSDEYNKLTSRAKNLYIALNMYADDDGIVNNVKGIEKTIGVGGSFLKELVETGFVLEFPESLYVITHWKVHNVIRRERYRQSRYKEVLGYLDVNESNVYVKRDTIKDVKNESLIGFPPIVYHPYGTRV